MSAFFMEEWVAGCPFLWRNGWRVATQALKKPPTL
jgi:hypothetical protein